MKFLKRIIKIIILFSVFVCLLLWCYAKYASPNYSGELKLAGLTNKVTVYFDDIGVPHINAKTQKDAYIALGYVHAQDRLWQMELIRRIAAGRLSEIFGKELIRVDKFFSGLGIEEAAAKTIIELDTTSQSYIMAQAYLKGINEFIEEGKTPIEFTMVGVKKEKYSLKDVYNVFGYMAFSFAVAHKTDPLLSEIKENLGESYYNEIITRDSNLLTINKTNIPKEVKAVISNTVSAIVNDVPISPFIGSNSWVIGSKKTKNGKVIFANDPHISYSQPSVWYQNHIKTPDFEIYGFNLALMPFPLLGHNKKYAYGLTMMANDDLNFYKEENNPNNKNQYNTSNGYKNYKIIDKTIKIKNLPDSSYQVKVSLHGPIMNNLIESINHKKPVAMYWLYTQLPNKLLDVCYGMSHANSFSNFKKVVSKIHAPGLNVMYGDAKDTIAWLASAKLYQLRDSLSTKTYLNGATGLDEIVSFLPFSENPKSINPPCNYVYSANNQPDSIRGKLYPGYYLPQDRAKRIVTLLESKNNFTKTDVESMLYDVKSSTIEKLISDLVKIIDFDKLTASERKALYHLKNWNGNYKKTEVGPTIYNRLLYEFLKATYKDELGKSFNLFINSPLQDQILPILINRKNSIWYDDISTKTIKETRAIIVNTSFKNAVMFLQNQLGENVENWTWNRVISVEYEHAIGKAGGLLRSFFNVGPFETIGGNEVINNQIFNIDSTGFYKITAGPSSRRVIDFSDVENSSAIIPTGQSGNVFSKYYKNQTQKYLDGKFVKMKLNTAEIKASKNRLLLKPNTN